VQAKGIDYTAAALLGDAALARALEGGAWATIYLSPRDYHRIHFPLGGRILGWRYVPGRLWPVNAASVRTVPGLFAVNERLVTVLDTPLGRCAVVAVGATVVGRVRAYYDPTVPHTNARRAAVRARDYEAPLPVEKGQELGAFEMGSTVILLFERGRVRLAPRLVPGARVRVGEPIGGPA
jgi:phosphatidylserine decarboxylase